MAIHFKFLNVAAMDLATELPDTIQPVQDDDGVFVFTLPPAQALGVFDPGKYLAGQTGSFHVKHLAISGQGVPEWPDPTPIDAGCAVGYRVPSELGLPAVPIWWRPIYIAPFSASVDPSIPEIASAIKGVMPDGLCPGVPPNHVLGFADANEIDPEDPNGTPPYTIFLSLEPVRKLAQVCFPPPFSEPIGGPGGGA